MMHWVGGLGIIVIFIALFPTSGTDRRRMVLNETSSASVTPSMPRMRDVTKSITLIYGILTSMLCFVTALLACSFEAIGHFLVSWHRGDSHSMTAASGITSRHRLKRSLLYSCSSVAINFRCYPRFFSWASGVWENKCGSSSLSSCWRPCFIAYQVWLGCAVSPAQALRDSSFQVVSMMTTTGFSSADYESWPGASQLLIFLPNLLWWLLGQYCGWHEVCPFAHHLPGGRQ